MEKHIKIINGSFSHGCGVMVHDTKTDKFYHLIVLVDRNNKEFVEIDGEKYYRENIIF